MDRVELTRASKHFVLGGHRNAREALSATARSAMSGAGGLPP
ncbi:hypothetical protein [Geodermatophilus sp. SYSU D01176]